MWQGREYIVWSTGDTDPQDFYSRPWEDKAETPLALKAGDWMSLDNERYKTRIDVKKDSIVIVLDDKGTITIPKTGTDVGFVAYDGDLFRYPAASTRRRSRTPPRTMVKTGPMDRFPSDGSGVACASLMRGRCTPPSTAPTASPGRMMRRGSSPAEDSWRNFYPKNGDVGTVVWTTTHCDADTPIAIVGHPGQPGPHRISGIQLTSEGGGMRRSTNPVSRRPGPWHGAVRFSAAALRSLGEGELDAEGRADVYLAFAGDAPLPDALDQVVDDVETQARAALARLGGEKGWKSRAMCSWEILRRHPGLP
jgi:hypothetical protein